MITCMHESGCTKPATKIAFRANHWHDEVFCIEHAPEGSVDLFPEYSGPRCLDPRHHEACVGPCPAPEFVDEDYADTCAHDDRPL